MNCAGHTAYIKWSDYYFDNCLANLSVLQHTEIKGVTFFSQLCLYLTVWLAGDYHFAPKSRRLWASHDQNLYIFRVKNANIYMQKICFVPNSPQSHSGVSNDQN